MLITPEEIKDYTSFAAVKKRSDGQLKSDILEATVEAKGIVGHDFSGPEYTPLPDEVRLALIKLAQFYALINADESMTKGYKSERFENYSYTLPDGNPIRKPDLLSLLNDFIKKDEPVETNSRWKMRII